MSNAQSLLAIAIMSIVTIAIRFAPFIIFKDERGTGPVITYLGGVLPYGVMAMLVVYCLRDTAFSSAAGFVPQLLAGLLVVLSYVWKRNTLISIVSGTICYMILVQYVF